MADSNNTWLGNLASGVAGGALVKALPNVPFPRLTEPVNGRNLLELSRLSGNPIYGQISARVAGAPLAYFGSIAVPSAVGSAVAAYNANRFDEIAQNTANGYAKLAEEFSGDDEVGYNALQDALKTMDDTRKAQIASTVKGDLPPVPTLETLTALAAPEVGSSDSSVLTRKGDFKGANTGEVTIPVPVPTNPITSAINNTPSTPTASSAPVSSGSSYTPSRSRSSISASRTAAETSRAIKNAVENSDAYTERNNGINWGNLLMMLGALGGAYALGRRH